MSLTILTKMTLIYDTHYCSPLFWNLMGRQQRHQLCKKTPIICTVPQGKNVKYKQAYLRSSGIQLLKFSMCLQLFALIFLTQYTMEMNMRNNQQKAENANTCNDYASWLPMVTWMHSTNHTSL